MLRFAERLPEDAYEIAVVCSGQSTLRPWGHRDDEGYVEAPHLALAEPGMDLTVQAIIPADTDHGLADSKSVVSVSELLVADAWIGAELRLVRFEYTDTVELASRRGIATVLSNTTTTLTVRWTTGFDSSNSATIIYMLSGMLRRVGAPTGYDNVRVLVPYQPEYASPNSVSGLYPATTTPAVPGYSVPSTITSFRDVGVFVPFCWNEGRNGKALNFSSCTIAGLVVTRVGGDAVDAGLADYFVGATVEVFTGAGLVVSGTVVSHTTGASATFTVDAWSPAAPQPSAECTISIPDWKDNPNSFGFRYPGNDMQPGGWPSAGTRTGQTYNRALGNLTPSYVEASRIDASINPAICSTGLAQRVASTAGSMTPSIASSRLVITCNATINTTGETSFASFLVPGHLVTLSGFTGTPDINGTWRVYSVADTLGGIIQLEAYGTTVVPGSIGTAAGATGAKVTRQTFERQHRFGPVLPFAWKLSTLLGRRVNLIHLGINAASLLPKVQAGDTAFRGTIGWWEPGVTQDWTPSQPNGLFARLVRMITVMAPAALLAEGNTKSLRVVGFYDQQGESEATVAAGRSNYLTLLSGFYAAMRKAVTAAGLSPYPEPARIPWVRPQITSVPWEQNYPPVFYGDTTGLVNTAIQDLVALDGGGATFDPNTRGKLDGTTFFGTDALHFNGTAEAQNGQEAATLLADLINSTLSQGEDQGATALCQQALAIVGEVATLESVFPPDDSSTLATLCNRFYQQARDELLEAHNWSFATRRAALVSVTNTRDERAYAYALPADLLKPLFVMHEGSAGFFGYSVPAARPQGYLSRIDIESRRPRPPDFTVERDDNGLQVLRCDVQDANLLYQARVSDVSQFSPGFRQVLIWKIAAKLVGALVKGRTGSEMVLRAEQMAAAHLGKAAQADAQGHRVEHESEHIETPGWLRVTW